MSKIKNVTIAAVCALGASAAMITPASAVGTATATYNCGSSPWTAVSATFTRNAPTTPATTNLALVVSLMTVQASPTPVGGAVATLSGTPALTLTNPNVVYYVGPTWTMVDFRMTGTSAATLTGPPASLQLTISNGPNLTCTVVNAAGWPI